MRRVLLILSIVTITLSSCTAPAGVTKLKRYGAMYSEKPTTILIMPPINRSTKVEAKEIFYSSLTTPLTLKGYYVLPPMLTMAILKEESAYDSEMFIERSARKFGEVFGADAVLFTTIHSWNKTTIASQINVTIEYLLKSAKTDEILFHRTGDVTVVVQANSGNAIADLISGMIITALTKEYTVGKQCNVYTISDMPLGKYSPLYMTDSTAQAGPKEFKAVISR